MTNGTGRDDLWSQYRIHVELFKYYLDLTVKVNAFYYAITGALVSFYLSRPQPGPLKYALLLPVVMGVGLSCLGIFGAVQNQNSLRDVKAIVAALGLKRWPDLRVLTFLLGLAVLFVVIVTIGLAILFWKGDRLVSSGSA